MKIIWDKKTGSDFIKGYLPRPRDSLDIIKVVIIGFFSFYVLADAMPYYFGGDTLVYGISVFLLSQGSIEYTNELMQRFEGGPFTPYQWSPTVHGTAVPQANVGIIVIGYLSFLVGGEFALFYVGPIASILLFIFIERITTRFFWRFCRTCSSNFGNN